MNRIFTNHISNTKRMEYRKHVLKERLERLNKRLSEIDDAKEIEVLNHDKEIIEERLKEVEQESTVKVVSDSVPEPKPKKKRRVKNVAN